MNEKFCLSCGGTLEETPWENGLTLPQCTSCGLKIYRNSKPCAAALIIDRENMSILLAKRGIEPYKGYWDLPGGFLRNGEDPKEGMKRELREEIGVECTIGHLLDIFVDTYGEDDVFTFNVCYIVTPCSPDFKPMDDVAEVKWFRADELPENLGFRYLGDIIQKGFNWIRKTA